MALCALAGEAVDLMTIVRAAHHTDNQYVGKHSSVMHPYVAAFGQKDCCLLIDCRWLESRFVPLHLEGMAILLCDSGLKARELPLRVYRQRRSECRRGVRLIRNVLSSVSSLRDLKPQEFASIEPILPEPVNRRCRHVVTENQRTLDAAAALARGDFQTVGNLMFQSHRSLELDYQVSVPQTNLLVDVARGADGVLGSRMTGGLFGGWTITLMRQSAMHEFMYTARDAYHKVFGSYPRFMSATSGGGACERSLMAS
jgi:galactokinase